MAPTSLLEKLHIVATASKISKGRICSLHMNCNRLCGLCAVCSNVNSFQLEVAVHIGDLNDIESVDSVLYGLHNTRGAIVNINIKLSLLHSDVRKDGSAEGRYLTVTWHMPLTDQDIYKSIWKSRISTCVSICKAVSKIWTSNFNLGLLLAGVCQRGDALTSHPFGSPFAA